MVVLVVALVASNVIIFPFLFTWCFFLEGPNSVIFVPLLLQRNIDIDTSGGRTSGVSYDTIKRIEIYFRLNKQKSKDGT